MHTYSNPYVRLFVNCCRTGGDAGVDCEAGKERCDGLCEIHGYMPGLSQGWFIAQKFINRNSRNLGFVNAPLWSRHPKEATVIDSVTEQKTNILRRSGCQVLMSYVKHHPKFFKYWFLISKIITSPARTYFFKQTRFRLLQGGRKS